MTTTAATPDDLTPEVTAALAELRAKVTAARDIVDRVHADLTTLRSTIEHARLDNAQLSDAVERMHHDHAGVRQLILVLFEELERLVPLSEPIANPWSERG